MLKFERRRGRGKRSRISKSLNEDLSYTDKISNILALQTNAHNDGGVHIEKRLS